MDHLISHRGNLTGRNPNKENTVEYILDSLEAGYDCEIDVWYNKEEWWLGHDEPQYKIDTRFLKTKGLWIHAKNVFALHQLELLNRFTTLNYFWHQEDMYTLTSNRYIWAYPGLSVPPGSRSICVLPEINNQDVTNFCGVCSDCIEDYK